MQISIKAPKEEVLKYFRAGGEFQQELREQSNMTFRKLIFSHVHQNKKVRFSLSLKRSSKGAMDLDISKTTAENTVFKARPFTGVLVLGILLLPFFFFGVIPIIGYFMWRHVNKRNLKIAMSNIVSKKFDVFIE